MGRLIQGGERVVDIVVIGASDQARCTIDILERSSEHRLVGVLDDGAPAGSLVSGQPVLGRVQDVAELRERHGFQGGVVAVGDNSVRAALVAAVADLDPDFRWATVVDPTAHVAGDATLGEGTVVMAGCIVNVSATLGRHVLLCAGAQLDHDSTAGDFASMGPGAVTGGNVRLGAFTNVAIGATVIHGRTVGDHTVIGAGATVVDDIDDHVVALGTPCRPARRREEGEPYL